MLFCAARFCMALRVQAYTHHYKKYGIEVEQMWQQVCSMEQVCSDYKALTYSPD